MSTPNFNTPMVTVADSSNLDAFSRVRTSSPGILFQNTGQYGLNTNLWETKFVGGSSSNVANTSSVRLSTGGTTSGNKAIKQSRNYIPYLPGLSQLICMTFVCGATVTNATTRIGYFDDYNGVYLEYNGSGTTLNLRSYVSGSVVNTSVAQASWNFDNFSGSGGVANPSGITLNMANAQILVIDLQWLGVGRVRVGFDINGSIFYAHQFFCANVIASAYMSTAMLPVRYEVRNTGTASGTLVLDTICSMVMGEGAAEQAYAAQNCFGNGTTHVAVSSGTFIPVCSIQASTVAPNSAANRGLIVPSLIEVYSDATTNPACWKLVLNSSLTGASFSSVASNSLALGDVAATAFSGGQVLQQGYATPLGKGGPPSITSLLRPLSLSYTALNNVQDTLTILAAGFGGSSSVVVAFNWNEIY